MVTVPPAGLAGMKGLYQPVRVDFKAIQEFMAFLPYPEATVALLIKPHDLEGTEVKATVDINEGCGGFTSCGLPVSGEELKILHMRYGYYICTKNAQKKRKKGEQARYSQHKYADGM